MLMNQRVSKIIRIIMNLFRNYRIYIAFFIVLK